MAVIRQCSREVDNVDGGDIFVYTVRVIKDVARRLMQIRKRIERTKPNVVVSY